MRNLIFVCLIALFALLGFRLVEGATGSAGAGAIAILVAAPLFAHYGARWIVSTLGFTHRAAARSVHGAWQGRHYAYAGQQIRFYPAEDCIWIAADDVEFILLPPPDERELRLLGPGFGAIPDERLRGYTEHGLLHLLGRRTVRRDATREMVGFKKWLETEALPNVRRLD